ncbi:MAG: hypothetical protein MJA83_15510 [Gammaproteobacteria bacterium]|nr:hypothetical protein [Gammaproteobacteria bacterium]
MRWVCVAFTVAVAVVTRAESLSLGYCASIDDATARLSCYDELAGRRDSARREDGGSEQTISQSELLLQETRDVEVAESPDVQGPSPPAPVAEAVREIGAEHLSDSRHRSDSKIEIAAIVSDVSKGGRGHLYFHLDNGHIWRQLEARHLPYPKDGPFNIVITRGMMGEYRLRVEGSGRMVRIRRVR